MSTSAHMHATETRPTITTTTPNASVSRQARLWRGASATRTGMDIWGPDYATTSGICSVTTGVTPGDALGSAVAKRCNGSVRCASGGWAPRYQEPRTEDDHG